MIIPIFLLMNKFHIINTLWSLILTYLIFTFPYCYLMLRSYMGSISQSMEEAAMIDGATRFGAFLRVVLPIALLSLIHIYFHIAIAMCSKNQILVDIMRLIVIKMQEQKFWQYTKRKSILSLGHSDLYLKEHSMLLDALRLKNEKAAVDIIKKHLNDVEKDYRKYF